MPVDVAPTTSLPALPSPVLVVRTFSLSSFAFGASALRPLSRSASAVAPGVVSQHLRNFWAGRDTEYAGLKNCFDAREVDTQRLTADL